MLFPTIEFTIFALLSLTVWSFFEKVSNKIFLLILFNAIFYSFYNPGMLTYLLIWTFIIYLSGYFLKWRFLIIGFAILQLAFWKSVEAKFITFNAFGTPLGISFFTFQGLTYLFARMGLPKHKLEQHLSENWSFLKTFAFIGFFPTVFSGPILRARYWEEQLNNLKTLTPKVFNYALTLIALGFFYKVCLSSIFHDYVSLAFANPKEESSINLLVGFYAYTFEIYHDFAGYSLMAIGVALLYGFRLPDNFKQPYLSINIRDFWQKWHISFSTWLRDYLYISLGGSKVSQSRHLTNSMIVMTICGAWHGLNDNYLVWGIMHGLAICLFHLTKDKINLPKVISWFITFHFVAIAWIFFRSPDATTGYEYLSTLLTFKDFSFSFDYLPIFTLFVLCLLFQKIESFILNENREYKVLNSYIVSIVFWSLIFILILIISPSGMPPFIYFSY